MEVVGIAANFLSLGFDAINKIMTLFITVLTSDLRYILDLFHLLAIYGFNNIALKCNKDRAILSRLFLGLLSFPLLFLFSSNFVREFLGFKALFDLIDFIFGLCDLFVSLIVPRIETHLQKAFSLGTPLI